MDNHGAHNTTTTTRAHHHHPYSGGGGGREDCWSEEATGILIQAWGDRYLQLNRGNLRQKDWKEVADTVNARQDGSKPRRTDVQCKNRIDTIKKKYKLEKSKQPVPSKWPFYSHLDRLIGSNTPLANKKFANPTPLAHKPPAVTFTVKKPNPNPNPNVVMYSGGSSSKSRRNNNSHGSTGSSHGDGDGDGDDDGEDDGDDGVFEDGGDARRKHRMVQDSSDGVAFRELARAILKFGEVYERIESSKQQQMMELERQRMEFTKDLEFQRMQMFMEAQLELEKMKRPKYAASTGKKL